MVPTKGNARYREDFTTLKEMLYKKKCFVNIKPFCHNRLARAVVIAKGLADKVDKKTMFRLHAPEPFQRTEAEALIPDETIYATPREKLTAIQTMLGDKYNIMFYSALTIAPDFTVGPANAECKLRVFEMKYGDEKFTGVITNPKAAVAKRHHCEHCGRFASSREVHYCPGRPHEPTKRCLCGFRTLKQELYDSHKKVCHHQLCSKCNRSYNLVNKGVLRDKHDCGEYECKNCKRVVPPWHKCYLKPIFVKKKVKPLVAENDNETVADNELKFISYDVETYARKSDGKHIPILVCAKHVDADETHVFEGEKCIIQFGEWLLTPEHNGFIVFAHNGGKYDHMFMLNYLLETQIYPDVVFSGAGLMSMTVKRKNIKFLDFYKFMGSSLASLPKALGLKKTLRKGHFPHKFSSPENFAYDGFVPALRYFEPETMSKGDAAAVKKWHAQMVRDKVVWNYRHELMEYCKNDVEILAEAIIKFRNVFMQATNNVDPFGRSFTLPMACHEAFREKFMPSNSIACVPPGGYRSKEMHSYSANEWLAWVTRNYNGEIRSVLNAGEQRILQYRVDGYAPATEQVYEFLGCYFHGCPDCFKSDQYNKKLRTTFGNLHEKTLERFTTIQNAGYKIEHMWECEWLRQRENEDEQREFVKKLKIYPPQQLKLFGGRTEVFRSFTYADDEYDMFFLDFVSMYPHIMKNLTIACGSPIIYSEYNRVPSNWLDMVGFAYVELLPPDNLHIPVLPVRILSKATETHKLLFCLCTVCAENQLSSPCKHSDDERTIIGSFSINEVKDAIAAGYKLRNVREVWIYPSDNEPYVFGEYMKTFMKLKIQASGWPPGCTTQEQKDAYVEETFRLQGIRLDPDKVCKDPALRQLAKYCLNNLWGKFCQKPNMTKSCYVIDGTKTNDIFFDADLSHVNIIPLPNSPGALLTYQKAEHAIDAAVHCIPSIGVSTTSHGRLMLQRVMDAVGHTNVCYCDTDSVAFRWPKGQPLPTSLTLGSGLGQLEHVNDEGTKLTALVATGAKSYAYRLSSDGNNKDVVKLKGFGLQGRTGELINFEAMMGMATTGTGSILVDVDKNFVRDKVAGAIRTVPLQKTFRPTLTKRQFFNDGSSLPWGSKTTPVTGSLSK